MKIENKNNIINIPVSEFNVHEKFVHNIILYNFDVPFFRHNDIDDYQLIFEHVHYNLKERKFSIKLKHTYEKIFVNTFTQAKFVNTITRERFAQFINGAFNLQDIIDKYDPSDKIVYSEELKKMDSAMFKNPNVIVICYDHNLVNRNGDESKLLSVTPKRFYLVEKVGSKYKLLTHNNFDKQTENCIYINADSRSIEYKIKEWNFTKNDIYPTIEGRIDDVTIELKKGTFSKGKISYTFVEFTVNEKTTNYAIDTYLRKHKEEKYKQSIASCHRNPCDEIELPGSKEVIISTTPTGDNNFFEEFVSYNDMRVSGKIEVKSTMHSDVIHEPVQCSMPDLTIYFDKYTEFNEDEFILNHTINIPQRSFDHTIGCNNDLFLLL